MRCLGAGLIALVLALTARAQERAPFEYDPYRVQIWVSVEANAALGPNLAAQLAKELELRSALAWDATWHVQGAPAPLAFAPYAMSDWDSLPVEAVLALDSKLVDCDKLMVVGVRSTPLGAKIVVRELDCRLRVGGELVERPVTQLDNLAATIVSAMRVAFSPVVRIEKLEGDDATAQLRAGGLITTEDSPADLKLGELLQPVLRRGTSSTSKTNNIQQLPYTFLQVTERNGYRAKCRVISGARGVLLSRGSRTEKLALRVRPNDRGTNLVLVAKGGADQPLVDYEVLTRAVGDSAPPQLLGITNRRGEVHVPLTADRPIELIYIRHGQQMLVRMPIVPGLNHQQVLSLTNDDPRLAAEGYFLAMQNNIMDLVARREVLAARIRLRVEQGDLEAAQAMLMQLRALDTRADLLRQIELQQTRFQADDGLAQAKVDKMFNELRKLLGKHLSPRLLDELSQEVAAGKRIERDS